MNIPFFILSPCGTSLLTHGLDPDMRTAINHHTNAKTEGEIKDGSPNDHQRIIKHLETVRSLIAAADANTAKKCSAELNGIISLYCGKLSDRKGDIHQLLCTDTWLGEAAAKIVKDWLVKQGFTCILKRQTDLRTVDFLAFKMALSDLVQWCEEEISPYRHSHHVVFNLTGGFKSIQGFLQTLAQFYADETVYIFETGNELLRLPRLPLKMDADVIIRQHLDTFRCLVLGIRIPGSKTEGIPETLLMVDGNQICLSPWGDLVWAQTKKNLYTEMIFPPPGNCLKFGPDFVKSVAEIEAHRKVMVNERIDDLVRFLEDRKNGNPNPRNPRSLDFKKLAGNPNPPSTHECDAWHDQDAKRLFGHFEDEFFVLDRLAKALH
ncbi:MAG: putative CRISPR-associated protein [Pseudomonadota bacterium]